MTITGTELTDKKFLKLQKERWEKAYVRAHARNESTRKTVENTVNKLTAQPDQPRRVTTLIAQFVLIRHPTIISNGVTYSTQVRNVGAGVKELYLLKEKLT